MRAIMPGGERQSASIAPRRPRAWPGVLTHRCDADELLDQAGHDAAELAANLHDIRTVNRVAGGAATVLRHLPELVRLAPQGRPVTILDLASGSGDIPRALLAWAHRNARPLHCTVSDASPEILAEARRFLADLPDVAFALYDARAGPLPDRSFEIVICSLALHHFPPPHAVLVLREMDRLASTGFIVNDIRRSGPGYVAAWVASRLATRNRLTRHDMPLSVQRAYTPRELAALLDEAGVDGACVTTHPLFRMAAVRHPRRA
jgi:ubiquinone/menaquinone biosynthesis C-methylase UbiE